MRMTHRHQYDDAADARERELTNIECLDETRTIQDAPDADLNDVIRRWGVKDGSTLPAALGITDPSYYGDFRDMPTDLADAMHRVRHAEELFMELPAQIRQRFDNNPYKLHFWVNNENNADEAIKLGLLAKAEPKQPAEPVTTPAQ